MSSGGGGAGNQTVTNTNVPNEVLPQYVSAVNRANEVSNRAYTPYQGNRIADLSGLQTQAIQGAQGLSTGQNFDQASTLAGQAGQGVGTKSFTDPGVAQSYMNPYADFVTSRNLREADRSFGIQQQNANADTIKRGGLGGYRDQLGRSEAQRNQNMRLDDIANAGNYGAYQSAGQLFNQDANRQLQADSTSLQGRLGAAQALSGIGTANLAADRSVLDAQSAFGSQLQQQQQRGLDQNYNDFTQQRDWDWGQLANFRNIISGINTGQTSTTSAPQGNTAAQLAGTGLSALAAYNLGK